MRGVLTSMRYCIYIWSLTAHFKKLTSVPSINHWHLHCIGQYSLHSLTSGCGLPSSLMSKVYSLFLPGKHNEKHTMSEITSASFYASECTQRPQNHAANMYCATANPTTSALTVHAVYLERMQINLIFPYLVSFLSLSKCNIQIWVSYEVLIGAPKAS